MGILNIIKLREDPETLRKKCRPVDQINDRIKRLLDDMKETLEKSGGVGLAAPQVGVLRRVVLVDDGEKILEMINPVIVATEGEQQEAEGCLSIPGEWAITKRPAKVTVEATDRNGNIYRATGEGIVARCFCHELDHLDGVVFTDNAIRFLSEDEIEKLGS